MSPNAVIRDKLLNHLSMFCRSNTLLEKRLLITPLFEAIKSIWIECWCFQWTEIDMKCTCGCSPTKFELTLAGLSLQYQVGSLKSETAVLVVISPNLPSHCGKFESTIAYFFSILTDCSNDDPSNPYRYSAWSACTCRWGHAAKCYCWSCGYDSCYRQTYPPEACCHWKFGARQVHRGTSEDHTSSRPCFVQDGPRGSLHKCPGLGGADEEFVWNECWPETDQQSALVPWLPYL